MGKPVKPWKDSEVAKEEAGNRRVKKTISSNLKLVIEAKDKGGGKSFDFVYRFPPNSTPKELRLGRYKKDLSLKQARDKVEEWKVWMNNNPDIDPRTKKQEDKEKIYSNYQDPTFKDLVDSYFSTTEVAETTLKNERNYAKNILKDISGDLKVKHLGWNTTFQGKTGRQRVVEHIDPIIKRGSDKQAVKVEGFIHKLFQHAIVDKGWLKDRTNNPADRKGRVVGKKKKVEHMKFLPWNELPELFDALNQNPKGIDEIFLYSIKFLLLHPVRVGSLVQFKWDYLNQKDEGWIHIPGEIHKTRNDFEVPITPHIQDLLNELDKRRMNEWLFPSFRNRKHIHPEAPQKTLRRMGFHGRQDAHGFRSTMTTNGTERMGYEEDLMDRCRGKQVGDEVQKAYSRGKFLEQRKEFITAWNDELIAHGLII